MTRPVVVGVSLKMYFGHRRARDWAAAAADIVAASPAVKDGSVEFFVIPSYLAILPVMEAFAGTPALIGAQDIATEDAGAFTGEVSGAELAEVGVRLAEVGHAERRRLFGESDSVVAAKTAAALRNHLTPVLCIGESERDGGAAAAGITVAQLRSALHDAPAGPVIVAYEPVWAIGARDPAPPAHIAEVCTAVRAALEDMPGRDGSRVIYGGSAGRGLLTELGGSVDGLFLGRNAHDPGDLGAILAEAGELARRPPRR